MYRIYALHLTDNVCCEPLTSHLNFSDLRDGQPASVSMDMHQSCGMSRLFSRFMLASVSPDLWLGLALAGCSAAIVVSKLHCDICKFLKLLTWSGCGAVVSDSQILTLQKTQSLFCLLSTQTLCQTTFLGCNSYVSDVTQFQHGPLGLIY